MRQSKKLIRFWVRCKAPISWGDGALFKSILTIRLYNKLVYIKCTYWVCDSRDKYTITNSSQTV